MGKDAAAGVSAYNDLQSVWRQLEELRGTAADFSGGGLRVQEIAPAGGLGGHTVKVTADPGTGEAPGQDLREFVRERLQTLYPGEDVTARTDAFLRLEKRLPERKVLLAHEYAEGLARSLNAARVRALTGDGLTTLSAAIRDFARVRAGRFEDAEIEAVVTSLATVGECGELLAAKTGKELAKSWQLTLARAPGAARDDAAEFVEVTSDAIMEVASVLVDFINHARSQLRGERLTADEERLFEQIEEMSESLTTYSRDIIALADDMVELRVHGTGDRHDLSVRFQDFTRTGTADERVLAGVEQELERIGEKAEELFSQATAEGDFALVRQRVKALKDEVAVLAGHLSGPAKSESRSWRLLYARTIEVNNALVRWLDGFQPDAKLDRKRAEANAALAGRALAKRQRWLALMDAERSNLRTSAVLTAVFDGRFDADFYLHCRNRGVTAEQLDFAYTDRRFDSRRELGSGAYNQTYLQEYRKIGCYEDNAEVVFKNNAATDLAYAPQPSAGAHGEPVQTHNHYFHGFNANYRADKVNFAVWKCARDWLAAPGAVVRSAAAYVKAVAHHREYGFVMERAPGETVAALAGTLRDRVRELSPRNQWRLETELLLQGADIDWCDYLVGQYDRHLGNVLFDFHLAPDGEVHAILRGIDNDFSFGSSRVGLNRFVLTREGFERFCEKANRRHVEKVPGRKDEKVLWPAIDANVRRQWEQCGAVTVDPRTGAVTVDRLRFPAEFASMFYPVAGINSARRPAFITASMLTRLKDIRAQIEAGGRPDPFERDFGDYLPDEALAAMRRRFAEMYDYALALERDGKVIDAGAIRRAGRGGETPDNEAAAKAAFRRLLEMVCDNRQELIQQIPNQVAEHDTYDLGYSILSRMNFFSEEALNQMHAEIDQDYFNRLVAKIAAPANGH